MRPYLPVLFAFLAACTAGEKIGSLREGMTPAQVEAVLGRPDGFHRSSAQVGYQYANRLMSGWGHERADYYAMFENDRLVSWGAGQVRQGPGVGMLMVVPVR